MAKLTIEEKAARYDALQKELRIIIEQYESELEDAADRAKLERMGEIQVYSRGRRDVYIKAIQTLKGLTD